MNLEHSRQLRLAARAADADESQLAKRLGAAEVAVSVESALPGAKLSLRVLLETLRRQPMQLSLDPTGLTTSEVEELVSRVAAIDASRPLVVEERESTTAAVHVGRIGRAPLRVIPDGYGARLARHSELDQARPANALGSVFAAALAAGEIFKEVAEVASRRQVRHEGLQFCPVTLSDDLTAAPELGTLELNLGLVGCGAVGTAIALILSQLPWQGRVLLVDPEVYAIENLGTYSLGTRQDAEHGRPKVDVAADALSHWHVETFQGSVEAAIQAIDARRLPWPTKVISGLDSIDARLSAQLLWPDELIDSATGDTALGIHDAVDGGPCLMCYFPPRKGSSALTRLIEATDLSREQLLDGDRALTAEDLVDLTEEKQELLRPHVGKPICGLARAIGLVADGDDSYMPAVPFVSQQAACLGVGRLVARLAGLENLPNVVQYDALLGPTSLTGLHQMPRPNCYSVVNREFIEIVRGTRRG